MKTIVIATGGYDPIHSGHIDYLNEAKALGDILVVGVNSDDWLTRKKGLPFMPLSERLSIVSNLKMVDEAITFDDSDGSACDAIQQVLEKYPTDKIIFANGGDRTHGNIPELALLSDRVSFIFGVGGDSKKNSSSWILQEWKAPKTERPWGYYRVIHEVNGLKVKELTVNPGEKLSMQRHEMRSEYWIVSEGVARVIFEHDQWLDMKPHQSITLGVGEWHQLCNPFDTPCKIVEIQYGVKCIEDDIERA